MKTFYAFSSLDYLFGYVRFLYAQDLKAIYNYDGWLGKQEKSSRSLSST